MRPALRWTAILVLIVGILIRLPFIRRPLIRALATVLPDTFLHSHFKQEKAHLATFTTSTVVAQPTSTVQTPRASSPSKETVVMPDGNPLTLKKVTKTVLSKEQAEGVGARVRRSIGTQELRNLDPFLMLDEFSVIPPAGFPDHPHRGFETSTYMLEGSFQHEDFTGRRGIINPGDLQWMTAGKGIVHAEMPLSDPPGTVCRGLQLWINLPGKHKLVDPRYQELKDADVPRAVSPDGKTKVKVIAGESFGVKAAVMTYTPIYYLDFKMEAGAKAVQPIPEGYTTFIYTLTGHPKFGSTAQPVEPHTTIVFSKDGEAVPIESGDQPSHFVLIAGEPIGEPIVQYGPFVMNKQQQIYQAFEDYQGGKNGFEHAPHWESEIGKRA
ncbi:hypothetical protein HDU96_005943 [Phlyctochytrium bullatum]|nr:hypothetical protein HDU96_005943 [Phlyctochytrium bullatum]